MRETLPALAGNSLLSVWIDTWFETHAYSDIHYNPSQPGGLVWSRHNGNR